MRKNIERTAWAILIISFLIFSALAIGIPLSVRSYLYNTVTNHTTTLTSLRGTVLAKLANESTPIPLTHGTTDQVPELAIITTDETSQAVLTFFDGSVVTLYNNTTLILHQARDPRFSISPQPSTIGLEVVRGRIRTTVASPTDNKIFWVRTPHAIANLTEGSFAVEANNVKSSITSRTGTATVIAQEKTVTLSNGQLTTILVGESPIDPIASEQNLVINGSFSEKQFDGWLPQVYVPADTLSGENKAIVLKTDTSVSKVDPVNAVTSTLAIDDVGGQVVLRFHSNGSDNVHTEASIEQSINKDVQDFKSLRINAQIRIDHQSLPGGGQLGTEFPVMIQLKYRDIEGNDRTWYRGFYYEPAPSNYILHNEIDNNNEGVVQFLWYPYESENLLDRSDAGKPAFIKSLRIYASGWIYDGMVTDIKLLAED